MKRCHKLRQIIIQYLYKIEYNNENNEEFFYDFNFNLEKDDLEYLNTKISVIIDNIKVIDKYIVENAHNWEFNRIGMVERQIFRLAIAEILHFPEVPLRVIINEAIILTKEFCGKKSSSFVNGVLDKIARILLKQ